MDSVQIKIKDAVLILSSITGQKQDCVNAAAAFIECSCLFIPFCSFNGVICAIQMQ